MLKRDAKRFDTNKKTDATKKRKSASSSSSEEEHDDEEEDEYDYGDAPYRDSTPGSSPSFDPSKKLDTFVSKAERMAEIASLLTENPEKNVRSEVENFFTS